MPDKPLDKQFGEEDKPYVDPNSGAAPQPGGAVSMGLPEDLAKELAKVPQSDSDPVFDAEMEHSAGPQGKQPGNPDGQTASEDGTSAKEEGAGSLPESQSGPTPEGDELPKKKAAKKLP